MKLKIIIWGTGRIASQFEHFLDYEKVIVIAYTDNDEKRWGLSGYTRQGYVPIINPDALRKYTEEGVKIAVASSYYSEIKKQLNEMQIADEQIIDGNNPDYMGRYILKPNYFKGQEFYDIEGFQVKLSRTHRLQEYKRKCLLYDAFIPYLAQLEEQLNKNRKHWIIDVGANVGDTVSAMIKYTSAYFLAVEPTESYYSLMLENVKMMDAKYIERIKPLQAYISIGDRNKLISLESNGTAIAVQGGESLDVPVLSIEKMLDKCGVNMNEVGLLKVDTDGFDADCIMSCGELLKTNSPILYYENQVDTKEQYNKYVDLCDYLLESGYKHYFVFDNFGNFIGRMDGETVKSINGYLATINSYWSPRTFYYVDILCCKEEDGEKAGEIIKKYRQNYPIDRFK